ncbi:protein stabilized1, partial [Tanacetum coccineum]
LEERLGRLPEAKEAYELGLKQCPNSTPLWLSLANLEERMSGLSKVRAVLTELWLAAIRTEARH